MYVCGGILDVPFDKLYDIGMRCIEVDLDNTLLEPGQSVVSKEIAQMISKEKERFRIVIITNTLTDGFTARAERIAQSLSVEVICCRSKDEQKPNIWPFREGCKRTGIDPSFIAMIGDQSSDIEGAVRAGVYAVMVKPMAWHFWWNYLRIDKRCRDFMIHRRFRHIETWGVS
jgi:HAD superfamily hydrolase (TIGR01662 family)